MNLHPLTILIENLTQQKNEPITFDEFKTEVTKQYGNDLGMKDNDDLFIIYSDQYNNTLNDTSSIVFNTKSIIYDKQTLKPIVSQYNNILYNENAINYVKTIDWNNIIIQKCYEGTLIIVFNHNNKWYISTRRCFDANESVWVKNNSYGKMFSETIESKFTFDDLDTSYCYHFVLVHHKNKNIVDYGDDEYKQVYHVLTTEKYTMNEIQFTIPNVMTIDEEKFNNIDELISKLNDHNYDNVQMQSISLEGYVLKCYTGEVHNSPYVTLKLQTKLYETLSKYKPNNSNIYQCFLELYQLDKLINFIPFLIKRCDSIEFDKCGIIVNYIHYAMRNMAKELSILYFATRNKNNIEMYEALPSSYKKILFGIHGIYLNNKSMPINALSVYNYLKFCPSRQLTQLFKDRVDMCGNNKFTFINTHCRNTITLCQKMFGI